jgi:hypothetical protein
LLEEKSFVGIETFLARFFHFGVSKAGETAIYFGVIGLGVVERA